MHTCVHVYAHTCMIMSWCVEEPVDDLEKFVSSFLHVGPGFKSQVIGVGDPFTPPSLLSPLLFLSLSLFCVGVSTLVPTTFKMLGCIMSLFSFVLL